MTGPNGRTENRLGGRPASVLLCAGLLLFAAWPGGGLRSAEAWGAEVDEIVLSAVQAEMTGSVEQSVGDEKEAGSPLPGGVVRLVGRVAVAMVVVVVLLYLSVCGMKRYLGSGKQLPSGQIRVLSRTSISPKAHVYLLEVGERLLVVGEAGGQLSSLATMEKGTGEPVAEPETVGTQQLPAHGATGSGAPYDYSRARFGLRCFLGRVKEAVQGLRDEERKILRLEEEKSK